MPSLSPRALANRANAQKSTGPRTPDGKATSSGNAVQHGVFAQHLLLPGENADELRSLKCSILRRLDPHDGLELQLVDRIVTYLWKLQRIARLERAELESIDRWLTDVTGFRHKHRLPKDGALPMELCWTHGSSKNLEKLSQYEIQLQNVLNRSLREFELLRKARPTEGLGPFTRELLAKEENRRNEPAEQTANAETTTEAQSASAPCATTSKSTERSQSQEDDKPLPATHAVQVQRSGSDLAIAKESPPIAA